MKAHRSLGRYRGTAVEFAYGLVAGENEVDLGILCAQLPQTAGYHLPQCFSCRLSRSSIPPDVDPCHLSAASC